MSTDDTVKPEAHRLCSDLPELYIGRENSVLPLADLKTLLALGQHLHWDLHGEVRRVPVEVLINTVCEIEMWAKGEPSVRIPRFVGLIRWDQCEPLIPWDIDPDLLDIERDPNDEPPTDGPRDVSSWL